MYYVYRVLPACIPDKYIYPNKSLPLQTVSLSWAFVAARNSLTNACKVKLTSEVFVFSLANERRKQT